MTGADGLPAGCLRGTSMTLCGGTRPGLAAPPGPARMWVLASSGTWLRRLIQPPAQPRRPWPPPPRVRGVVLTRHWRPGCPADQLGQACAGARPVPCGPGPNGRSAHAAPPGPPRRAAWRWRPRVRGWRL